MTDDVDAPTVVDAPNDAVPEPSGNGTGGPGDIAGTGAKGEATPPKRSSKRAFVEWGVLIVSALLIAIVIKTFLFQAFYIPSGSMIPTLEVGDRVLVNKLSYDLHDLHRVDIVVFQSGPNKRWPTNIDDLVKRVIALPGETVTQCTVDGDPKRICIDDRPLNESYLPKSGGQVIPTEMPVQIDGCDAESPRYGCKVPAGDVFVMGDNRGNSADARSHGPIKESSIVGRVFLRIWPPGRIGFM